jgi:hypothetical protein
MQQTWQQSGTIWNMAGARQPQLHAALRAVLLVRRSERGRKEKMTLKTHAARCCAMR